MRPDRVGELAKKYGKRLTAFIKNRGAPPHDAKDIVQDTWVRMLRYGTEDTTNAAGYLMMSASRVMYENAERSCNLKPHETFDDELNGCLVDLNDALDEIFDEQLCKRVREVMAQLPPRQHQALVLHLDGMTYKEIAAHLGVTYRIVLRDLTRAYASMRAQLQISDLI